MKKLSTLVALACLSFSLFAQNFDQYSLLKNEGAIPTAFTTSSTDKYEQEILNMEKEIRAREKKDQKQFYLETNFVIDDLLLSGKVLFGTELNKYVEKVAAKVLQGAPDLKDKVQFYILRSSAVNAFATNQGIIFINMGMLAQLENEAQLAFIIAHELMHVRKQHSLNMFLEKKNIDRTISRNTLLRQSNFDEALIAKNRYSKELEFEADNGGLELYLQTGYNLHDLAGVFDVLRYSHLLFDIEEFDRTFFNKGTLVLPKDYFLDSVKMIQAIDDSDDTKSTHPATIKRLEKIQSDISDKDNTGRSSFLISQEEFLKVRKIARFELVYYYLHYFRYEDAIYTAFLLLQENPNSLYLHKSVVQALHGMSKYLNAEAAEREDGDFQRTNNAYKEIEGPQQNVYYCIEQLKNNEMTIVALRYAWAAHQQFPDDKEIEVLLEDLFTELAFHYEDLSTFKIANKAEVEQLIADIQSGNPSEAIDTTATKKEAEEEAPVLESKYAKIREQQKEKATEPSTKFDFKSYAFGDIIDNEHFKAHFEKGKEIFEKNKKRKAYWESKEGEKEWAKRQRIKKNKGASLGIDSVLILNPFYLSLDVRKDNSYRYIETEKGQERLKGMLQKVAKSAKVHYVFLDAEDLKSTDAMTFNEIHTLNDWFSQQTRIGDWKMPGFNQAEVEAIAAKYGTPYILKTGVVLLQSKKKIPWLYVTVGGILGGSLVTYLPFPANIIYMTAFAGAAIYVLTKPRYESLYYGILYDVKNQRYEVLSYEVLKTKDTNQFMSAYLYKIFHQIKKK